MYSYSRSVRRRRIQEEARERRTRLSLDCLRIKVEIITSLTLDRHAEMLVAKAWMDIWKSLPSTKKGIGDSMDSLVEYERAYRYRDRNPSREQSPSAWFFNSPYCGQLLESIIILIRDRRMEEASLIWDLVWHAVPNVLKRRNTRSQLAQSLFGVRL